MKTATHEIGGVCVYMTASQAERWNAGGTTERDLDVVHVAIPVRQYPTRYMTLRRATNDKLEPDLAQMMDGMPANRCGEWK